MTPENLQAQLHLLEGGINTLKEGQRTQAEYLGLMMREIIEIRADAKSGRSLGEFVTLKLSPLLKDPTLLVELEELKRERERDREEMIDAMPPAKHSRPSISELSPSGQLRAITEAELKLVMALDRVHELEEERERREAESAKDQAERDKEATAREAALQKQLDAKEAARKFWFKTIISVVGIVVSGVAVWQITTTLASHEKSTTVETKEKQR